MSVGSKSSKETVYSSAYSRRFREGVCVVGGGPRPYSPGQEVYSLPSFEEGENPTPPSLNLKVSSFKMQY